MTEDSSAVGEAVRLVIQSAIINGMSGIPWDKVRAELSALAPVVSYGLGKKAGIRVGFDQGYEAARQVRDSE